MKVWKRKSQIIIFFNYVFLLNEQIVGAQYVVKLESYLKEDSTVQDIYRASISLLNFGKAIDSTKVGKALAAALKKDESLLNTGLAFQLAAKLTKAEDRNPFVEKIGDIIVQADEVDNRFLQVVINFNSF